MNFLKEIKAELTQEAAVTRKFLERVDFSHSEFKPHPKSESFGRLAVHVAELLMWWENCLTTNELNFEGFEPKKFNQTEELLVYFDELLFKVLNLLETAEDSILTERWQMKLGDELLFESNKKEVLRKFCMNHLVHHRAQLGMYLRLLNIPVPATYGPSEDEGEILLIKEFYSC